MKSVVLMIALLFSQVALCRVPPLHELHEEVLRQAGFDREEIGSWKEKTKWAAALPRIQVGFDQQLKDVVSLSTKDNVSVTGGNVFVGPNENNFDKGIQQGLGLEVKAVWSLDELVFSRDRIEASRETRNWLEDRSRLLERVTEIYFRWKREREASRREELAGQLDGYTRGWFSEQLRGNP